jgi:endoglucanase
MMSFPTISRRFASCLLPVLLLSAMTVTSCGGGGGGASTTAQDMPLPAPSSLPAGSEFAALAVGNPPGASSATVAIASKLAPGVNFGNILEAPSDGAWGISYNTIATLSPIAWKMGFKSVRLPVRWSNHAGLTEPYTIDAEFMTRVKNTVQALNDQGFIVVMDMHHYRDLDGDTRDLGETAAPSADHKKRMVLMWKQIAEQFKDFSNDKLVFEVYNEPHKNLQIGGGSVNDPWNALLARAMGQIRASNPNRIVVVGPTGYNNTYNLQHLQLPNDANMIVTVHQYEPFNFTHQGAEFLAPNIPPTGQTCCSQAQKNQITTILNVASAWASQKKYPIYVGEFGAYGNYSNTIYSNALMSERINFNNYMRTEMTRLNFSWSYWEMAAGFGVYDLPSQTTRTTLLGSLIP